jgi:hypothetical protein
LTVVCVIIFTASITFVVTKLTYAKADTINIADEYQCVQQAQPNENSYDKIQVSNVFTGVSNVHITYEQSNKMYSINLHQTENTAAVHGNPEYDDCVNVESGHTSGIMDTVAENDSEIKLYESPF